MRTGRLAIAAVLLGTALATPSISLAQATAPPSELLTGHYLTNFSGEGVFIEHIGAKAFLTFATYDGNGQPTWFVVPNGQWQFNAIEGRSEFTGQVYKAIRGQESPPSIHATAVGNATWYPSALDTITFSGNAGENPYRRTEVAPVV